MPFTRLLLRSGDLGDSIPLPLPVWHGTMNILPLCAPQCHNPICNAEVEKLLSHSCFESNTFQLTNTPWIFTPAPSAFKLLTIVLLSTCQQGKLGSERLEGLPDATPLVNDRLPDCGPAPTPFPGLCCMDQWSDAGCRSHFFLGRTHLFVHESSKSARHTQKIHGMVWVKKRSHYYTCGHSYFQRSGWVSKFAGNEAYECWGPLYTNSTGKCLSLHGKGSSIQLHI